MYAASFAYDQQICQMHYVEVNRYVKAARHLHHCEILQGEVSTQDIQ